jgi:hypothetical protein
MANLGDSFLPLAGWTTVAMSQVRVGIELTVIGPIAQKTYWLIGCNKSGFIASWQRALLLRLR